MSAEDTSARRAQQPILGALALLVVIIVALVAAGIFSAYHIYELGNDRFVKQAGPFFAVTEDLAVEMLNEETGVRGYVITRDPRLLQPYYQGRKYVRIELALIQKDEGFDPRIPSDLANMQKQVGALESYFAHEVALTRSGVAGQKQAAANIVAGKGHFDHLRTVSAALIQDAANVVSRSHREQHGTFLDSVYFLSIAGVIALAIAAALSVVVPRRLVRLYRDEAAARREAERGADAARALAHVRDAVLLLSEAGMVRYENPAAERLFGRHEDVTRVLAELRRSGAGPRPVTVEGREVWLTYAETRFDGGRVAVLRDVSDDLRLERLRSDFVATAAHELRTPLAAVYGAVRTLRQTDHELSPDLVARFLEMIENEAERLKVVMDQLLVSAHLDREDVQLNRERVDISDLCKSVVSSVEMRKPDGIELAVDCPDDPVPVDADAERLRQVVSNLIDNAIKYSPDGGRVELRIDRLRDVGLIEVSDRGLGIPSHEQERIFEKFYRLDPTMRQGVGGSGLGLYISRELVQHMGGRLSVSSRLGEGSTFTVTLPLSRAA
ncbi:MAG: CHASE3 domain-containing protein [Actinobacteria bacterium]|nr:CHASE3 domain-containing protein [Actinomycetota bacterium]